MNLARSLERRLERLIEGFASKLFPGAVSGPELAQRIIREADLSVVEGPAGPVVPNIYGVRIHPDDLGSTQAPADLTGELAAIIDEHALQNGWRIEGAVHVQVVADPEMSPGSTHIAATVVKGALPRWAYLALKATGDELSLGANRILIGRDIDSDVRLDAEEVSRSHAIIWREDADFWIADIGSSNGTTLNGSSVTGPRLIANGDSVVFGSVECTFRVV
ncbi:MAG: FhaA domain-containing protein [Acidimicrobiia bacterium]